ncbi:MAG TPA: UDP-N-acetylglucosamine 2-epimerase (non-hydrolyzing) [Candidatus Acidoferrales bacterium]|nr:UDP-N-acetylglucosamine 2-epimerase (non-hydrolyzing) [Candidatus Acidoferrales bacterium]
MIKILNVAGARPNFMKVAPLVHEMNRHADVVHKLVHTGQHYDVMMSKVFFDELDIPPPDVNLEVGGGERLAVIDKIMARFEPVVRSERPDAVLVVGDVNSTIACARVAREYGAKVVHVEAGLRSFDRSMPEELNRVETDQISDFLFVTEPAGMRNIADEGLTGRALLVGNVMIDTLVAQLERARAMQVSRRFGLEPGRYVVATFHRPSNVDDPEALEAVVDIIQHTCAQRPMVLPVHPRTRQALVRFGLNESLERIAALRLTEPLGYLEFLSLVSESAAVVTDSGGIQEETTYLKIPCVTMRENTERPITVDVGTNVLAGTRPAIVKQHIDAALRHGAAKKGVPDLWDGRAAVRIVAHLREELAA